MNDGQMKQTATVVKMAVIKTIIVMQIIIKRITLVIVLQIPMIMIIIIMDLMSKLIIAMERSFIKVICNNRKYEKGHSSHYNIIARIKKIPFISS